MTPHGDAAPHDVSAEKRATKIVATLGPATHDEAVLGALIEAGVDVARLNFSHGTHAEHAASYATVRKIATALHRPVAIMQDLQGPKIRVDRLVGGLPVMLRTGDTFRITIDDVEGTAERVSTTYPTSRRMSCPATASCSMTVISNCASRVSSSMTSSQLSCMAGCSASTRASICRG